MPPVIKLAEVRSLTTSSTCVVRSVQLNGETGFTNKSIRLASAKWTEGYARVRDAHGHCHEHSQPVQRGVLRPRREGLGYDYIRGSQELTNQIASLCTPLATRSCKVERATIMVHLWTQLPFYRMNLNSNPSTMLSHLSLHTAVRSVRNLRIEMQ